ncbi:MAG: hypothetical protein ACR2QH_04440, partial [Geminicoccaceae bacterium]
MEAAPRAPRIFTSSYRVQSVVEADRASGAAGDHVDVAARDCSGDMTPCLSGNEHRSALANDKLMNKIVLIESAPCQSKPTIAWMLSQPKIRAQ